jgi:uncharacterized protein YciI
MEFDRWSVLFLTRREPPPALTESAADVLQDAHLEYLAKLHAGGQLIAAGPVERSQDSTLAGICLYRGGVEEARALGEDDPAVRAGVLGVTVVSWSFPKDAVRPGAARFPRSMADVGSPG